MADRKKKEKQANTVKGKTSPTPAAGKGAADQTPQADPIRAKSQPIQPDTTATEPAGDIVKDAATEKLQEYRNEVKQDAAQRMATAANLIPKELREILTVMNVQQMQATAAEYAQIVRNAVESAQKGFNAAANIYQAFQSKEWKEATEALKSIASIVSDSEIMQQIIADAAAFYKEVEKELQKPEYEGLTVEQLEELAEDPAADPKYKELWQQAQDNARAVIEERAAQEEAEAIPLPLLQSINPERHTMPNNTLMNELAGVTGKKPINAGPHDLPVIPEKKRQKEITAYIMAVYETEKGIVSNLTEYERDVSDAILSIWEQAKKEGKPAAFTTDSIYRAMPGRGERASSQQKGAITKAVEKFLHLYLDIDATDELRRRGVIGAKDTYHVKDYYLSAQEHIYRAQGGQPIKAWKLNSEPIMLNYAKMTGQIISVPSKYLAIEKVKPNKTTGKPAASGELITMNAPRQAMTSYMLRRIAIMKNDLTRAKEAKRSYDRRRSREKDLEEKTLSSFREQSDTILFDTLFKRTGTETTNRELARRNREFCFDVLDYWKVTGLIRDYSKHTKGRSITGIEIIH